MTPSSADSPAGCESRSGLRSRLRLNPENCADKSDRKHPGQIWSAGRRRIHRLSRAVHKIKQNLRKVFAQQFRGPSDRPFRSTSGKPLDWSAIARFSPVEATVLPIHHVRQGFPTAPRGYFLQSVSSCRSPSPCTGRGCFFYRSTPPSDPARGRDQNHRPFSRNLARRQPHNIRCEAFEEIFGQADTLRQVSLDC